MSNPSIVSCKPSLDSIARLLSSSLSLRSEEKKQETLARRLSISGFLAAETWAVEPALKQRCGSFCSSSGKHGAKYTLFRRVRGLWSHCGLPSPAACSFCPGLVQSCTFEKCLGRPMGVLVILHGGWGRGIHDFRAQVESGGAPERESQEAAEAAALAACPQGHRLKRLCATEPRPTGSGTGN